MEEHNKEYGAYWNTHHTTQSYQRSSELFFKNIIFENIIYDQQPNEEVIIT